MEWSMIVLRERTSENNMFLEKYRCEGDRRRTYYYLRLVDAEGLQTYEEEFNNFNALKEHLQYLIDLWNWDSMRRVYDVVAETTLYDRWRLKP